MEAANVQDPPSGSIKYFFGSQATPKIAAKLGSFVATPRTGAMGKSDEQACNDALNWTLVALKKRAKQVGANAVIQIVSFYRRVEMSSPTEFECHVGNVIVSVALKGELVRVTDEKSSTASPNQFAGKTLLDYRVLREFQKGVAQ
jgi:uncharacterized protein YbjQ (UPF0145 family)